MGGYRPRYQNAVFVIVGCRLGFFRFKFVRFGALFFVFGTFGIPFFVCVIRKITAGFR